MHCDQLQCQDLDRNIWVILTSKGKTLDVGCHDGSPWTKYLRPKSELDIYYLDLDLFVGPSPFIRADAHNMPFKDDAFDTVVFSDIIEHAADPLRMLLEGKRITNDQILVTVPDEWSWDASLNPRPHPTNGDHEVDPAFFDKWRHGCPEEGIEKLDYEKMLGDISTAFAVCKDVIRDERLHHFWHLRYFTLGKLQRLLDQVGMEYGICHLHYFEGKFVHFAAILKKGG